MAKGQKRERLTDQMRVFLSAYEGNLNISASCRITGISRRKFYDWKGRSEKFREAWEDAHENGVERLEAEAYRRAVEGVAKKRFGPRGEPVIDPETGRVYVEYQYSDKLLLTLLRRYRPDEYAELNQVGIFPGHTRSSGTNGPTAAEVIQELHKDPILLDAIRTQSLNTLPAPAHVDVVDE